MFKVAMTLACLFFGVFVANVSVGAAGRGVFLSDIQEMLCLFAECFSFVVAILVLERNQMKGSAAAGLANREEVHD